MVAAAVARGASSAPVSEPTPPPTAPSDSVPPNAAPATATASQPAADLAPEPAPAPRRSFLDQASIRPTAVVAIIIAALFYGTQILNEALPAAASEVPVTAGGTVDIGPGTTITPLSGWAASAHDSGNGIRLEKGIVAVDLFSESFGSTAVEVAEAYRDEVLKSDTTQFTATTPEVISTASGLVGARFRYQGLFTGIDVAIEGEVTVVCDGGVSAVADAWTRQGGLDAALGEVHAMLQTVELRP